MSFLDQISVLILTKNEEANIARSLKALSRFPSILVLDSGSDDATCDIVAAAPNASLAFRAFDEHALQWNHGLSLLSAERPWVLALDADYLLTEQAVDEIAALSPDVATAGYRAQFRYCIYGEPLRASLYPSVTVLFRHRLGTYEQHGHTQRLTLDGGVAPLTAKILHDDRKSLPRWLAAQSRYAMLEADHILAKPSQVLRRIDRLRRAGWIAPLLVLPYMLLMKRCLFDGWRGWFYALQRLAAESMIALAIMDRRADPASHEPRAENHRKRSISESE